jgi:hypothetical protein
LAALGLLRRQSPTPLRNTDELSKHCSKPLDHMDHEWAKEWANE